MLIVGIEDDSYASVLLCSCDDFFGGENNGSVVSNIGVIISLLLPHHELQMIILIQIIS